ncbi:MAG: membrane protein insertase YidC [Phycisphaerales bacterium JB064]
MAAPSKSIARVFVPLAVLAILGLLIALPLMQGNKNAQQQATETAEQPGDQSAQQPTEQGTPQETPSLADERGDEQAGEQGGEQAAEPAGQAQAEPDAQPEARTPPTVPGEQSQADGPQYHVLPVPADDPSAWQYTRVGGIDPSTHALELSFSLRGAGVERIELAGYKRKLGAANPVPVQEEWTLPTATGGVIRIVPFAAIAVEINGQRVSVYTATDQEGDTKPAWAQVAPGRFQAFIADEQGTPVVRLERHYQADGSSHDFTLVQSAENLTGQPMSLRWITFGPAQLYQESQGYGGDKRRVRFGYVEPGSPHFVVGGDFMKTITQVSGPRNKQTGLYQTSLELWPNNRVSKNDLKLAWTGLTNRYFGAAVHGVAQGDPTPGVAPLLSPVERVSRVLLDPGAKTNSPSYLMGLELTSPAYQVAPSETSTHALGIYTGPLDRSLISANPSADAVMLRQLVQYTFGGPCAVCTFPWLAHILIGLLHLIHSYVTFDWALAIIVLVLIVRTILHPITKWSQIRVQRFSHQMQQMAPKQKKIQEKYKGDPKRMQAEMAKLWREEGINPAGMLGCMPMLLQTPVWIALYASLYFAIELRHQPAFFGLFQHLGGWPFLADLAQPDSAIPLPASVHFELPLMGTITAINLLPLLLGVVFFIQQKYMMPPPSATMTPEQQAQQRMMKVMMVIMFPVFMYNAPSGLAVYFITNSTLGILEMRYIRAHINKNDLLTPKQRNPGKKTFMQRLMERAQQRQEMIQAARGQGPAKGPTSGALGARRKKTENRRKGRRP